MSGAKLNDGEARWGAEQENRGTGDCKQWPGFPEEPSCITWGQTLTYKLWSILLRSCQ